MKIKFENMTEEEYLDIYLYTTLKRFLEFKLDFIVNMKKAANCVKENNDYYLIEACNNDENITILLKIIANYRATEIFMINMSIKKIYYNNIVYILKICKQNYVKALKSILKSGFDITDKNILKMDIYKKALFEYKL